MRGCYIVTAQCRALCVVHFMVLLLSLGCNSRYTDVIRAMVQNNMSQLGHLCLLFFPPVATATSETNN